MVLAASGWSSFWVVSTTLMVIFRADRYIDTSSLIVVKIHRTPIQTKMKPYTNPAGPPLVDDCQTIIFSPREARDTLAETCGKDSDDSSQRILAPGACRAYESQPSQVIIKVQLKPNVDQNPKFRYDYQYHHLIDLNLEVFTFKTCFLPSRANRSSSPS